MVWFIVGRIGGGRGYTAANDAVQLPPWCDLGTREEAVALNIKNPTVERLATEVARRLGVSKSEAVRRALEAQLERIAEPSRAERSAQLVAFLERDVWPYVPPDALGRAPDRRERELILGYGEDGV